MSNWLYNWGFNLVGPPWFRRLRTAIRWYRSGRPMIELRDLEYFLAGDDPIAWLRACVEVQKIWSKK